MSRALHPSETDLLRFVLPALKRSLASRRRVAERAEAVKTATEIADGSPEAFVAWAQRAFVLSRSVQAEADLAFQEAFFAYLARTETRALCPLLQVALPACVHGASASRFVEAFCTFYGLPTAGDAGDEAITALLDLGLTVVDGGRS